MNEQKIEAHKVTKPIQLLAAWLIGLLVIDSAFLAAAKFILVPSWGPAALVIAAIINVPIFLFCIFLLQTKFRPEMQEDTYYSQYLDKKTDQIVNVNKIDLVLSNVVTKLDEIKSQYITRVTPELDDNISFVWGKWKIAINDLLEDFTDIRAELKKNRIPTSSIFRKSNASEPPALRVISINRELDFKHVYRFLCALISFEFNAIMFWDPYREVEPEDIYIGSYGI